MLQREDIRKTMTLEEYNFSPKNSKETIIWQFTCDNKFIKQRWISALEGLMLYYNKEKKDIEKFFNDHGSQMKSSSSGGSRNSTVPWRDSQTLGVKIGDVSYLQLIPDGIGGKINRSSLSINDQANLKGKGDNMNGKQYSSRGNNNLNNNNSDQNLLNKSSGHKNQLEFLSAISQSRNSSVLENKNNPPKSPSRAFQSIRLHPNSSPIHLMKQMNDSPSLTESKTETNYLSKIMINQDYSNNQIDQQVVNKKPTPVIIEQSPILKRQYNSSQEDESEIQAQRLQIDLKKVEAGKIEKNKSKVLNLEKKESKIFINLERQLKSSSQELDVSNKYKQQQNKQSLSLIKQSSILSNQQKQEILSSSNHSFNSLVSHIFQPIFSFNQKLALQRKFYYLLLSFKHKATNAFMDYVHSRIELTHNNSHQNFKNNSSQFIIQSQTKVIVPSQELIIKLAYPSTQTITINNEPILYYNEENIKNLKKQYKVYEQLFKVLVLGEMRVQGRQISLNQWNGLGNVYKSKSKLRVPLVMFIEYKGITGLVIEQIDLKNSSITLKQLNFNLVKSRISYQKEIQLLNSHHYQLKHFKFFRYSAQSSLTSFDQSLSLQNSSNQQILIYLDSGILQNRSYSQTQKRDYLKSIISSTSAFSPKHHNIQFIPPFNQSIIIESKKINASLSLQSLQNYVKTLKSLQDLKGGICPKQQIIQILEYMIFCKQLRKIYRVAQGEINQTDFINLVLMKKDEAMAKILKRSGVNQIPKIKGILFTFLTHYLGVDFVINQEALKKLQQTNCLNQTVKVPSTKSKNKLTSNLILSTEAFPLTLTYPLDSLEIFETSSSLQKFIQEQKYELAQKSLQILRFIQNQNGEFNHQSNKFQRQFKDNKYRILYNGAILALIKDKDCLRSLQLSKQAQGIYKVEYHEYSNNNDSYNNSNKINPQPRLFFLYLHMLKCYKQISASSQFNFVIEKLFHLISFNYGNLFDQTKSQNSLKIKVCQIVAYYLTQMNNQYNNDSGVNIALQFIDQALELTERIYPLNSTQIIDALIDSSNIYKFTNLNKSEDYFNKAKYLVIKIKDEQKILQILIQELKNTFINNKNLNINNLTLKFDDIFKVIYEIPCLYHKTNNKRLIELLVIQFQIGLITNRVYLSKQAIDRLWLLNCYKSKKEGLKCLVRLMQVEQNEQQIINTATSLFNFQNHYSKIQQNQSPQPQFVNNFDQIIKAIEQKFQQEYEQHNNAPVYLYKNVHQNNQKSQSQRFKRIDFYDWIKQMLQQGQQQFQSNSSESKFNIWQVIINNMKFLSEKDI